MGYCPFPALGRDRQGVGTRQAEHGWVRHGMACAQGRAAAHPRQSCPCARPGSSWPPGHDIKLVSQHGWGWDQVGPWLRHDFSCRGKGNRGVS